MNSTFKIAWWNAGLTIPIKNEKKGKRTLTEVINILIKMYKNKTRIFGICEISIKDITSPEFSSFLSEYNLQYETFFENDGNIVWDIVLIYDSKIFSLENFAYIQSSGLSKHKKLAIVIEGNIYNVKSRLFLSHFPTLLYEKESEKVHMYQDLIYRIKNETDYVPYTIAMGDYNIELCSNGIIEIIARSRKNAIKQDKLYSPFMRHIGEKYQFKKEKEISGTIYNHNQWLFYDFITTTPDFFYDKDLEDSYLFIDDFNVGIWDEIFNKKDIKKDHLPVYITIGKGEKNGLLKNITK